MINITVPKDDFLYRIEGAKWNTVGKRSCIYKFYNSDNVLLYVGKTKSLQERMIMHLGNAKHNQLRAFKHNFSYVSGFYTEGDFDNSLYEIYLINTLKPKLNHALVYTYESERYDDSWKLPAYVERERRYNSTKQKRMAEVYESSDSWI